MKSNYPFYKWVPKWLGILVHIFMFFPILFVSGTYTSNSGEMTSGLGIISEHIQFSNFATAIGMVVFTPFMVRFLEIRRTKMVFLLGFIFLFFLSFFCANTDSIWFLMLCSLLTGFIRIILIFNTLFSLITYASGLDVLPLIKPDMATHDPEMINKMDYLKAVALPFLYLFFICIGQIGSSLTAWLAYEYEWQYVYYFMMGLTLAATFLTEVTMKYENRVKKIPVNLNKFGDIILAAILMISLCYVLIYGKTLDWFDDISIRIASILFLLSLGLFIVIETNSKSPYLMLQVLRQKNVLIAVTMFMLLMLVNSSSMLVTVFTDVSMKINNVQKASLSNYSMIGYVIGAITASIMAKKNIHFKYLFCVGFLFIIISAIYMYFQYQSMGLYKNMIFPTIIRSAGMIMLYAMSAVYGMKKLPMKFLASWIFVMLAFRSVIAPVTGTTVYANLLNERQQYYITRLSQNIDMLDPQISATYSQTVAGSMMQGRSYEEAQTLAATSIKGRVQVQAVLASLKEITGLTIFAGFACIVIVLSIRYTKEDYLCRQKLKSIANEFIQDS